MTDLSCFNKLSMSLGGRNLYLTGMMGSGKSLTGPPLAKNLAYGFVDIDQVVEKIAQKSIQEIFDAEGEIGFRDLETQVLKEIGKRHSLVVATGGGIVTRSENWGILHQGVVIWIDPNREILLSRLKADQTVRPMLENNLIAKFDALLKERLPLYRESDLHLSVCSESPEEVALSILRELEFLIQKEIPNE